MSNNQSNKPSNPFEDECSPFTPIKNNPSSRFPQERQGYILSPPPAPKASQRAYRLSNDERKKQDLSQIARKLTFDDHDEEEGHKNGIRYARNGCHHRNNHHDQDDDGRPMNPIRFDGHYTFMDEVMESSQERPSPPNFPCSSQNMIPKTLGSPIHIHPDHTNPPQSSQGHSDPFSSSSSTLYDSPIDGDDGAKNLRKRNHSIGQEDHHHDSPPQNFRSIQASNHIEAPKYTQAKRTRIPKTSDQPHHSTCTKPYQDLSIQQTEDDPFDSFLKPLASTPFIVQLQRTATHSGMDETGSIPSSKQTPFTKQLQNTDPSSSMHRSISNASYLLRTPNEFRESQLSKVVVPPRMKYNMAQRSIHQAKQFGRRHNRSSSVFANSQTFNITTPSICSPFSSSNTPSPVVSKTTLPNILSSQPIDYFGNWSAASSPLTQAH